MQVIMNRNGTRSYHLILLIYCIFIATLRSILSCNPKVHHRVHKSPPMILVHKQKNLAHVFLSYFLKIHFNILKILILYPSVPAKCRVRDEAPNLGPRV
jgi:hypothetical protein